MRGRGVSLLLVDISFLSHKGNLEVFQKHPVFRELKPPITLLLLSLSWAVAPSAAFLHSTLRKRQVT